MSVTIDHELLDVDQMGLSTVGQVLSHLHRDNRLVTNLLIDGESPDLSAMGVVRRQVLGMLACEGLLQAALAVLAGLALGTLLSVVLVYVINRQSFHWSIDLAIPWGELAALGLALMGTAALTAWLSGRAALGEDVIRAVREDW